MAATTRVALGVVGCGAITEMYYAPSVRELERAGYATVTAIFDPSAERVAKVGAQMKGAKQFTDFSEFVKSAQTCDCCLARQVSRGANNRAT